MSMIKRFLTLLAALSFALPVSASAASKKNASATPTPAPLEITSEVADVPDIIQSLLDIAYQEWETTGGQKLPKSNKYTQWRNSYKWEWCAGFTTWCTLEAGLPQDDEKTILKMNEGDYPDIYTCKGSAPATLLNAFQHMNRITMIPQKGYIVLYGEYSNSKVHVGLVWDVEKLEDGKYRLTTIEGNMSNTVKMYIADYEPVNVYYDQKHKVTVSNLSEVPEDARTGETGNNRTYDLRRKGKDKKKPWYVTCFLMTWIPDETISE